MNAEQISLGTMSLMDQEDSMLIWFAVGISELHFINSGKIQLNDNTYK